MNQLDVIYKGLFCELLREPTLSLPGKLISWDAKEVPLLGLRAVCLDSLWGTILGQLRESTIDQALATLEQSPGSTTVALGVMTVAVNLYQEGPGSYGLHGSAFLAEANLADDFVTAIMGAYVVCRVVADTLSSRGLTATPKGLKLFVGNLYLPQGHLDRLLAIMHRQPTPTPRLSKSLVWPLKKPPQITYYRPHQPLRLSETSSSPHKVP